MKRHWLDSHNPQETMEAGKRLAKHLTRSDIVCLFGDLGAGKTTFVKGLAKGLRIPEGKVHSPTFVLMNIYEGRIPVYHFDFYRIDGNDGSQTIGFDEFFYGEGISVVEWSEHLGEFLPNEYLKVELKHKGDEKRSIFLSGKGAKFQKVSTKVLA